MHQKVAYSQWQRHSSVCPLSGIIAWLVWELKSAEESTVTCRYCIIACGSNVSCADFLFSSSANIFSQDSHFKIVWSLIQEIDAQQGSNQAPLSLQYGLGGRDICGTGNQLLCKTGSSSESGEDCRKGQLCYQSDSLLSILRIVQSIKRVVDRRMKRLYLFIYFLSKSRAEKQ